MTKKTSKIRTMALKIFSIPLLVVVMLMFSEKVSAQIEPGKGVSKELFREYKKQVRKATVTVKDENGNKRKEIDISKLDKKLMREVYAQMSPEQKMKVQPIPGQKPMVIAFNGEDFPVLNLDELKLDEITKLGLDAGDLGIKIAGNVISGLDLEELKDLNLEYFDSPGWEAKVAQIEKNAAEIEKYYDSPEWKKRIDTIEKNAEEIEQYYNSPEWKAQIEKIERNAREIEEYYNSPEWKEQTEKIEQNAREIERYYNSPEWKAQIEKIEKEAVEAEKRAKEAEKKAKKAEKNKA